MVNLAVNWYKFYGVGTSTISDIKKNLDSIMIFTCALEQEVGSSQRKVMKKPHNEILENADRIIFVKPIK